MSVAAAKSRVSVSAWVMTKWPYRFDCSRDGIRKKFCWQFQVLQMKSLPVDEGLSPREQDRGYPRIISYGTMTVNSPGVVNVMTPPQMHINCEVLSRVGMLPRRTVGAPSTQGAGVLGMHGMGVSTPRAAAVAAATVGLAGDIHMPKGKMLVMGM